MASPGARSWSTPTTRSSTPNKSRNAIIEACSEGLRDRRDVGAVPEQRRRHGRLQGHQRRAATGLPDYPIVTTEIVQQCSPVSHGINPPVIDCATKDQHPQTYRGSLGATKLLPEEVRQELVARHLDLTRPTSRRRRTHQVPAATGQQDAGIKKDAELRRLRSCPAVGVHAVRAADQGQRVHVRPRSAATTPASSRS